MADIFEEWLNSGKCRDELLLIARKVIWRAKRNGIELDDSYFSDDFKEYCKAVASNIWIFMKEESDTLAKKATVYLKKKDCEGFSRFVINEFIDSCIDKRRNDSPFHAYYRHMREVLSDADGINYKSIPRQGSYYAWSQTEGLALLPDDYDFRTNNLDYSKWNGCSIPLSQLHHKPAMISLSRHYWDESLRVILAEYLLSIRGLVAFTAHKYPLIPTIEYESGIEDGDDENQPHHLLGETLIAPDHQLPVMPPRIVEVDLELIARDCAAKLTAEERIVISSMDSATGTEIAKALGKKGGSNVDYYKKPALKKVREHWSQWSQPDSEYHSIAVDECRIFIKMLVDFCNKANDCRDCQKEGRS